MGEAKGRVHRHEDGRVHVHYSAGFTIGGQTIPDDDGSSPHEHGTLDEPGQSGPVARYITSIYGEGWGDHDPPEYAADGRLLVYRWQSYGYDKAVGLASLGLDEAHKGLPGYAGDLARSLVYDWSPVEVVATCTCGGVGMMQHLTSCPLAQAVARLAVPSVEVEPVYDVRDRGRF